ncbi:MAG: hypothetical protein Q8P91_00900 [bacterium]|nr:hypothetical protein [bacterium]
MNKLLSDIPLSPSGGFKGIGPLGNPTGSGIETFTKFISTAVGLMTIVAIIWFVFLLISGGIGFMTAGSDKAQIEASRKKIVSGLIGLVVIIAALFLIDLIGYLIGIPNILNLTELFGKLL